MSRTHRSHKLMDWISTYDSSSLVGFRQVCKVGNGTKWWLFLVTEAVSSPSYHFPISRFSTRNMLSLQFPKILIDIISFWHNSRMALWFRIWLFKDIWRLGLATCLSNCSTNAITGSNNSFRTNTKIMVVGTQMVFHKVLVLSVLFYTTVREAN